MLGPIMAAPPQRKNDFTDNHISGRRETNVRGALDESIIIQLEELTKNILKTHID